MTIYNVLIKSSTRVAGTTTTNGMYNLDWSAILPDNTAFKVGFVFLSDTVNVTALTSVPQLIVQLGGTKFYRASATSSYTVSTNLSGYIPPPILSTTTYLQANTATNNRIYLDQRPTANTFFLTITSAQPPFPTYWVDNVGATINSFDLVLSFETVDKECE